MATGRMTDRSVRDFIQTISTQKHAMAGAAISASAAQALALGRACVQISLNAQNAAKDPSQDLLPRLDEGLRRLTDLCDLDASAIAGQTAEPSLSPGPVDFRRELCSFPAETAELALEAISLLISFRSSIHPNVRDDMEMSIALLCGAANAATLLLESNLRIWPDEALISEYHPHLLRLETMCASFKPIDHVSDLYS